MSLSHHCASCGLDLTRRPGVFDAALRLRVVVCPHCSTACVRAYERWRPLRRQLRRLLCAVPVLVISMATCAFASILIFGTSLSMVVEPPTPMASGALPPMAIMIVGFPVDLLAAGSWIAGVVLLGIWLGVVHSNHLWRAPLLWLSAMLGVIAMAVVAATLEGLQHPAISDEFEASRRAFPFNALATLGLIVAAILLAIPMMLLARIAARREHFRRVARKFRRARRRRAARAQAVPLGLASVTPHAGNVPIGEIT